MAKQVVEWEDSKGKRHTSEEKATRADLRIAAEMMLIAAGVIINTSDLDLSKIDGYNTAHLAPIKTYIDLLYKEAEERTKKHG